MTGHEHDWRVDPYRILATSPPLRVHVCATCGAEKPGLFIGQAPSFDPATWPKADTKEGHVG